MLYTVPDEIIEEIKPYGKGVSLAIGFSILLLNRKRYLAQIEKGNHINKFYSDLLYWLILFLPLISKVRFQKLIHLTYTSISNQGIDVFLMAI